jgi:hypothetical protein
MGREDGRHAELAAGRAEVAAFPNIHLLERDSVFIAGVELLGCTLWTDYRYAGAAERADAMAWASQRLNDHRLIGNGSRRWSPQDCLHEHTTSRAWLAKRLRRRSRHPKVAVTHHAPSRLSVQPQYKDDPADRRVRQRPRRPRRQSRTVGARPYPRPSDYVLSGCRVVANPRGYIDLREDGGFDPALVVELPAPR